MRYISPEINAYRFRTHPRPQWDTAILCFRDARGSRLILDELDAEPLPYKVISGIEPGHNSPQVSEVRLAGDDRVGVVPLCQWGGPQTAIFVEELAWLGVSVVIGIGACGGLRDWLPKGSQVIATAGLPTDGTSAHYGSAQTMVADSPLLAALESSAAAGGESVRRVVVATVDALYQETERYVQQQLAAGADVLNMETSPFYAACAACGIRALWLGHVSDSMVGGHWQSWERLGPMTRRSARIVGRFLATCSSP